MVVVLVLAYRSFGRFRQAHTHLDTPPFLNRRHPGSAIAPRPGRIASPGMLPSADPLPHLKCSGLGFGGDRNEADQHGNT